MTNIINRGSRRVLRSNVKEMKRTSILERILAIVQLIVALPFAFSSSRWTGFNRIVLGAFLILLLNISVVQMGSAISLSITSTSSYGNVNGGGTQPSCYHTATTWNGVTGNYVSYGIPSGDWNCPSSLNLNSQSGFGFVKATIPNPISDGVAFKLGTFTHYNHPISANKKFNSIDLTITLTVAGATPATTSYTYTQYLDETPNSGTCGCSGTGCCAYSPCNSPCPDKVYWSNLGSSSTFTASDGKIYTLEILGFADCSNPGTPISYFVTQEDANNVACIYAKITECVVTITGNPSPVSVCPNGNAQFTVTATGPALTYQWYKQLGASPNPTTDTKLTNTAPYSGVTTSTMIVNPATSSQAGSYYVVVKGSCGTTQTSTSALLTVNSNPSIITQPSSQSACADGSATFNVAAIGSGTLTYQWYKQLGASPNPATDTKLTNTAPYSGVTTPTMTINPASSLQAGTYYVVVTSSLCGSVTSNSATLTVQARPTASAGPAQSICAGSTVQLAGLASNYNTVTWSGGAGTFDNTHALNAIYTPGQADITAGLVALTLTATPISPCASPATSIVVITINAVPTCVITAPTAVCEKIDGLPASVTPFEGASYLWTVSGDGQVVSGADSSTLTWKSTAHSTGNVRLSVRVTGPSPTYCYCENHVDIPVQKARIDVHVPDDEFCIADIAQGQTLTGTVENYNPSTDTLLWTIVSGNSFGKLTDPVDPTKPPTHLSAIFTPIASGGDFNNVVVRLTATRGSPCSVSDYDDGTITVFQMPAVDIHVLSPPQQP